VFELLVSGDAVVPDYDAAVERCSREWGLPPVHPNWVSAPPGAGGKWCFARLQPDRRLAPTAFEILGIPFHPPAPGDLPDGYAYLPEIAAVQGERPARNHSTVVSATAVEPIAERIHAAGGECRLDGPDAMLPFPRLWVGFSPTRPGEYSPGTDGGLRIEVIPHSALAMPNPDPQPEPVPLAAGAPVRIVARTLVVDDLDGTLSALNTNLGWEPDAVNTGVDGVRRARFEFAYPRSAVLEVAGPEDDSSPEGRFLAQWGTGPFSIRIAVTDLATLEGRYAATGVALERLPEVDANEGPRLYRAAERNIGTALEFVEETFAGPLD
jgi:hypothetical protein